MRDLPEISSLFDLADEAEAVARCRAIAARERAAHDAYGGARNALAALYGAAPDRVLLARLAADLRAGRFESAPERQVIERLLWDITVQKLRESNPGFLPIGCHAAKM